MDTDKWFDAYTKSFLTGDYSHDHGFELKILHTRNVVRHARELEEYLEAETGPDPRRRRGTEMAALLHDAGRFEQFRRYRTFNDSISEDHGKIALDLIEKEKLLEELDAEDAALGRAVRFAVFEHNKLAIPPVEDKLSLTLAKLVRDADRIDIFRIMAEHLRKPADAGEETVFLHLADTKKISTAVYESLQRGEMVHRDSLHSRSDFLCQILSWIRIMNYPYSCKLIHESGNFDSVLSCLPRNVRGLEVRRVLKQGMEEKLKQVHPV